MSEIRMFDLGYPKADLGHGSVWATTFRYLIQYLEII